MINSSAAPMAYMGEGQEGPVNPLTLKRGGKVKGLVPVHMAPDEVALLDDLQGETEHDKVDGRKIYKKLGALLENPRVIQLLKRSFNRREHEHLKKEKYATGGAVHGAEHAGRGPDSEVVYLTPKTVSLLEDTIGGATRNPHTGYPEFFLGSLLAPLAGAFLAPVAGSLGNMAAQGVGALGNLAGQGVSALGRGLTSLGSGVRSAASSIKPAAQQAAQTLMRPDASGMSPLSRGLQSGLNAYSSGATPGQAALQGFGQMANSAGGPVGRGFGEAANAYLGGNSPYQSAMRGISAGAQGMSSPYAQAAGQFAGGQMMGENPYQSAARALIPMAGSAAQSMGMPPSVREAAGVMSQRFMGGERDPRALMSSGAQAGLAQFQNPYAQAAGQILGAASPQPAPMMRQPSYGYGGEYY